MADSERCRILVVDDDPNIRRMLSVALPEHGFDILEAADGAEALALLEANAADVAAALIDVCMPEMDGPSVAWGMREVVANLPVCFMTGDAGSYYNPTLRALGPVLRKPFRPTEVARLLRWVGRSRPATSAATSTAESGKRERQMADTVYMGDTRTGGELSPSAGQKVLLQPANRAVEG